MVDDEEQWVDTGDAVDNAFAETVLEDPAKALAEARGQAAQASAESTEHAAPMGRQQPPLHSGADVPPPPAATPPVMPPASADDLPGAPPEPPTGR